MLATKQIRYQSSHGLGWVSLFSPSSQHNLHAADEPRCQPCILSRQNPSHAKRRRLRVWKHLVPRPWANTFRSLLQQTPLKYKELFWKTEVPWRRLVLPAVTTDLLTIVLVKPRRSSWRVVQFMKDFTNGFFIVVVEHTNCTVFFCNVLKEQ